MCEIIILQNGTEIETVEEFENYFGVYAEQFINDGYKDLVKDACLCQLDIMEFMERKGFAFDGNWWEIKQ